MGINPNYTHLMIPREDVAREKRSLQNDDVLPICEVPDQLGVIEPKTTWINLSFLETLHPEVNPGGWYKPTSCSPRDRIIVFIPYRNRAENLAIVLRHLHRILIKQQLEYRIIVVEQDDRKPFNKGQLYNAAFIETLALIKEEVERWDCFIFHDADLLALYWNTPYKCGDQPIHISVRVDKLNNVLPYYEMFGGVTALTYDMFIRVNGYSNRYWHWGAEDDDMSQRLQQMGFSIERPQEYVHFIMLPHPKQKGNPYRHDILRRATAYYKRRGQRARNRKNKQKGYNADGLITVTYNLVTVIKEHLFTLIRISFDDCNQNCKTRVEEKTNEVILRRKNKRRQILRKLVLIKMKLEQHMKCVTVSDRAIASKSEIFDTTTEIIGKSTEILGKEDLGKRVLMNRVTVSERAIASKSEVFDTTKSEIIGKNLTSKQ